MATLVKEIDNREHEAAEELKAREDANPEIHELLETVRAEFKRRGARGITGLSRKFRIIDDSGDGHLDMKEFQKCMKEQKLDLTVLQVNEIFKFFDADASGTITYDEFLIGLRGELNERRQQLVLMAFDVIDKDHSGILELDDITEAYDASQHPDVIAGKKTKNEILREFLDTFDGGEKDGKVYPDEFIRYYSNVSASIDEDDYFELMIRNAWHIPGGEGWCANTANKRVLVTLPDGTQKVECIQNDLGMDSNDPKAIQARLAQQGSAGSFAGGPQSNKNPTAKLGGSSLSFKHTSGGAAAQVSTKKGSRMGESSILFGKTSEQEEDYAVTEEEEAMGWSKNMPPSTRALLRRLQRSLKKRGANSIAKLGKKFQIIDDDGSGTLELAEFEKCMEEHKLGFTKDECDEMFRYFDADGSGTITYDEFLGGIRGELNQRRAQLVLMAFDILDADKSGFVEIDDIRHKYDASGNPDVVNGKKTEEEILAEFLDTFDTEDKDGKVTPAEFCRYYSNVSASVDLDDYFELMIRNAWHIPGGEGWCANTANKRVLVTHPDGRQTVECIQNDLGLDLSNPQAIQERLVAQGIDASGVETFGKLEDDAPTAGARRKAPNQMASSAPPPETRAPVKTGGKAMQKTSLW